MSSEEHKTYVIRRVKKVKKHGHHGGSWKIAYADFVTAMMAFFLLLWLLSLLNHYQLAGIAEYFKKPLFQAMQHESNQKGKGDQTEKEKFKEKETEKEKEKEKESGMIHLDSKEKPIPNKGFTAADKKDMETIKAELQQQLDTNPELQQYKNQLNFIVTSDGLKIQLRDLENKPMFTTGKADFDQYAKPILGWLANQLNHYDNRVMILGHTDGAQYSTTDYTNWELSADRANAVRRILIKNGMDGAKVIRVEGVGDKELLDSKNVLDPANRRIEIIIMTDQAIKNMEKNENASVEHVLANPEGANSDSIIKSAAPANSALAPAHP